MDILQAIIIGLVQGLTEFLPTPVFSAVPSIPKDINLNAP